MLRSHAFLQDRPAPDRFPNGVTPLVDVVAQGVEACRRQGISGVWIHSLLPVPRLTLHSILPVMCRPASTWKPSRGCHAVSKAPRLAAVEEDSDDNGLVEHARDLGLDLPFAMTLKIRPQI